ncbi:aspartate/glutamate racemase family protein [Pseudomonas sp. BN515]|uniref:maleate cis-trans isomerase family protein n=1 Tax=Pseudomonas sp. BN515 TaxID=2567892 RepID=UPI0024559037|nr:aspartate/glutamate racemase family protein [Pseudomonas sp. BN515]MDH4872011.1 arylmalonate decarboxylase [Pseudomonas sp. BN515]
MNPGIGSVARIGQLYPSGGLCDHEIQWMAPAGVRVVTTRVPFRSTSLESDRAFAEHLEEHAQLLVDARVDLLAVNCTAATMLAGPENIRQRLQAATGLPIVTTIEAVIDGCKAMGMRNLGLVTPYPDEVVEAETAYLGEYGFSVKRALSQPCGTPFEQASLSPASWLELARSLKGESIDGVLVSCAGIQIASVIQAIEQVLGLPVVTSNQALLWQCLRALDLRGPVQGFGGLLSYSR